MDYKEINTIVLNIAITAAAQQYLGLNMIRKTVI